MSGGNVFTLFLLLGKVFIYLSFLRVGLLDMVLSVGSCFVVVIALFHFAFCGFFFSCLALLLVFSFSTVEIICRSLLACKCSAERPDVV